ncbi:hypothetical protein CHKEEEPN_0531 [Methylorubrum podarium]|nr:hypothetical protein CHKEEEPN_0531 [Methylorubrum podarium]
MVLLTAMALAALSVSVVGADHATGAATVMLPACVPELPVETVTLALASAPVSVVALMTESLPVAVKPPVSAPFEMVTL